MNHERCLDLIAGFELFRSFVYDDDTWPSRAVSRAECTKVGGQYKVNRTSGTASIGYGETDALYLESRWDSGVTEPEARARMSLRVNQFANGVANQITRPMTDHQHEAMTSLAYNIGLGAPGVDGGFYTSTVKRKFNEGDVAGAAEAFRLWVKPASLKGRREIEIKHFLTSSKEQAPVARISQEHLLDAAHPELARRFRAGCARFGGDVRVNSVLRDSELQRQFSECYQAKRRTGKCPPGCSRSNCAPANPPGTSNHEPHGAINKSLAIDAEPVNNNWAAFQGAMRAEGLIFPIGNEPWHAQCKETPLSYYEAGSENRLPIPTAPTGPKEDELFSESPIYSVHLVPFHSRLVLTSLGDFHGAGVVQARANGSLNQRWMVVGHEDGTVGFVNRAGDLALDRPDYKMESGTHLQVARLEHNWAQRWRVEDNGYSWRIWAMPAPDTGSNAVLDMRGRTRNEGDVAQLWAALPADQDPTNQHFIAVPTL